MNLRKILEILSVKNVPSCIMEKLLVIIDHLIYTDESGVVTMELIKNCDIIDKLWGLKG